MKAQQGTQEMKGWLFKWTNYLKGYQRRWFVLSNGLLSYYRYSFLRYTHYCNRYIYLQSFITQYDINSVC